MNDCKNKILVAEDHAIVRRGLVSLETMIDCRIRILVADNHAIVRRGLVSFLSLNESFEVIGDVTDGRMAVNQALEKHPDVVLVDICIPVLDGLEVAKQLKKLAPDVKVLVLSADDNEEYIDGVAKSGAMGYVLKNSSVAQLSEAILVVHNGQAYFSPPASDSPLNRLIDAVSKALLNRMIHVDPEPKPALRVNPLTARERQVLQLFSEGKSHKEIAAELFIADRTVDNHVNNIMQKLELTPSILDDFGIIPALRLFVNRFARQTGIEATIDVPTKLPRRVPGVEATLYRVVQEAFSNVAQHSRATRVTVRLTATDSALTLDVSDNGVGFNAQHFEHPQHRYGGLGLLSMKERISELNGSSSFRSAEGEGTSLHFDIPLKP